MYNLEDQCRRRRPAERPQHGIEASEHAAGRVRTLVARPVPPPAGRAITNQGNVHFTCARFRRTETGKVPAGEIAQRAVARLTINARSLQRSGTGVLADHIQRSANSNLSIAR